MKDLFNNKNFMFAFCFTVLAVSCVISFAFGVDSKTVGEFASGGAFLIWVSMFFC